MAWIAVDSYTCRTCNTETETAYVLPSKPDKIEQQCKDCDVKRRAARRETPSAAALPQLLVNAA